MVTVLDEGDVPDVTAMLGRCSRATLYKRFHGFTDGVAYAAQALADPNQDAYGTWSAGTCVGMASLALDKEGYADIGVLVEDQWQSARRRLGTYRSLGDAGQGTPPARAGCGRSRRQLLHAPLVGPGRRHHDYVCLLGLPGAYRARPAPYRRCYPGELPAQEWAMISYHLVASVSDAQRLDLLRQAERQRLISEGRVVRRRVLRQSHLQRRRLRTEARAGTGRVVEPVPAPVPQVPVPRQSSRLRRLLFRLRWATAPSRPGGRPP